MPIVKRGLPFEVHTSSYERLAGEPETLKMHKIEFSKDGCAERALCGAILQRTNLAFGVQLRSTLLTNSVYSAPLKVEQWCARCILDLPCRGV